MFGDVNTSSYFVAVKLNTLERTNIVECTRCVSFVEGTEYLSDVQISIVLQRTKEFLISL